MPGSHGTMCLYIFSLHKQNLQLLFHRINFVQLQHEMQSGHIIQGKVLAGYEASSSFEPDSFYSLFYNTTDQ